mmetsp:Transcript_28128/g.47552  ORF Transcript_28128/g.47552 Transcript_28128/m.47552 type:complete len:96 (-) Transcript_28128:1544-1831(-)
MTMIQTPIISFKLSLLLRTMVKTMMVFSCKLSMSISSTSGNVEYHDGRVFEICWWQQATEEFARQGFRANSVIMLLIYYEILRFIHICMELTYMN